MKGDNSGPLRELIRASAFALTTAEFGLSGRIDAGVALEAVAAELDHALQSLGCDIRDVARLQARAAEVGFDN